MNLVLFHRAFLKMGKLTVTVSVLATIATFGLGGSAIQYFDLGYTLDETNIFFPGQRFSNYQLYKDNLGYNFTVPDNMRFFFAMFSMCMGEHGGTHVDSPYHFNEFGWKLDEILLERLVDVPLSVIDVEEDVFSSSDPGNFKIELAYILEHEEKYGKIRAGSVVMFHMGWGERYWPDFEKYFGVRNGSFYFPGLSGEAVSWLIKERKVVGVGVDGPSPDVGNNGGNLVVHLKLCRNNVYIIENLTNLKTLLRATRPAEQNRGSCLSTTPQNNNATAEIGTECDCDLRVHVLPLKTRGTGGQARVLAFCKNH